MPMPGMPVTETRRARCSRAVAWSRSLMSRSSSSRPTNGGSRRSERPTPLRWATTRTRPPGLHGLLLALQVERPDLGEGDRARGGPPGGLVDEHGARRGDALHPRGRVDGVAEHHAFGHLADRDRDLSGDDSRPGCELHAGLGSELGHRRHHFEGGAHGPLGVVLVRDRCSPDAMTASPMNFSTVPAVVADDGLGALEVEGEELSDLLGVPFLGERREADEVDEKHRAQPTLGRGARRNRRGPSGLEGCPGERRRPHGWCEGRAALVAEPGVRGKHSPAIRATAREGVAADQTELAAWRVVGLASFATHRSPPLPEG